MVGNAPPERPRTEPEIIPPDRGGRRSDRRPPWNADAYSTANGGPQRVYVTRLGPVGVTLLLLAAAALAAFFVVVVIGTFLIWLPIVAVLVVIAALFRLLRG